MLAQPLATHSFPADWVSNGVEADDALEATGLTMSGLLLKECRVIQEECQADVVDWEARDAQEVLPAGPH